MQQRRVQDVPGDVTRRHQTVETTMHMSRAMLASSVGSGATEAAARAAPDLPVVAAAAASHEAAAAPHSRASAIANATTPIRASRRRVRTAATGALECRACHCESAAADTVGSFVAAIAARGDRSGAKPFGEGGGGTGTWPGRPMADQWQTRG